MRIKFWIVHKMIVQNLYISGEANFYLDSY